MQTEFKTQFEGVRGRYRFTPTNTAMRGITDTLREVFYPKYTREAATKSETITSGLSASAGSADRVRCYGRQTPLSAGLKRGTAVGKQLQAVHSACCKHKLKLGDFVRMALLEKSHKEAQRKRGVIKSKQDKSKSKAAILRRAQTPRQVPLGTDMAAGVRRPPPAKVTSMMQRLHPLTMRALRFIVSKGWEIAAVELIVGHLKTRRATGIDLLLYSTADKGYIATELKTGYGLAHSMHTGNNMSAPFEDKVDSPANTIQLQVLCNEILLKHALPGLKLLYSQELLVTSASTEPQIFKLADWASERRDKFWSVFSKY